MAVVINGNGNITGLDGVFSADSVNTLVDARIDSDSFVEHSEFNTLLDARIDSDSFVEHSEFNTLLDARIDSADFVTLTGTQTITGAKTFVGDMLVDSGQVKFLRDGTGAEPYINLELKNTGSSAGLTLDCTLHPDSAGRKYEIQSVPNGNFIIYDRTSAAYRFTIDSSGNVGIGTTSPTQELDVAGDVVASSSFRIGNDSSWKIRPNNGNSEITFEYATSSSLSDANIKARIRSDGNMLAPYQVGFQATRTYAASNQSLASDTAILAFDTTIYNTGSAYNTSTYRFTAPVAGRYLFAVTARLDALTSGSYARVGLMINGSTNYFRYGMSISGDNHSTNYESQSVTAILDLAANDYVQAYGGRSGGGGGLQFESQFSGILLG